MTDLVSPEDIERIVGVARHRGRHHGRAVSSEQTVYILHSHACRDSGIDLRECEYSRALDMGIDPSKWVPDFPLALAVVDGELVPDWRWMLMERNRLRHALEQLDAMRPDDYMTGQDHLPPAFREVNYREAFRFVVRVVNGVLHDTDENGQPL